MIDGFPPLANRVSFEDRVAIEDVLDAAAAFAAGDLPFFEAAGIGTILNWRGEPSPPYSRYVALRITPRTDPRREALAALIDTLIAKEGWRVTRQGVYSMTEIRANEAGWEHANLERRAA